MQGGAHSGKNDLVRQILESVARKLDQTPRMQVPNLVRESWLSKEKLAIHEIDRCSVGRAWLGKGFSTSDSYSIATEKEGDENVMNGCDREGISFSLSCLGDRI